MSALDAMRKDDDPLVRERVEERIAGSTDSNDEHAVIEMNLTHREERRR